MDEDSISRPKSEATNPRSEEPIHPASFETEPDKPVTKAYNSRQACDNASNKTDGLIKRLIVRVGTSQLILQFAIPAITGFLTLALIFVQTRIYSTQTLIFDQQLAEMKKSNIAASDASKAAQDAVELSREASRLDQRAWLIVTGLSLMKPVVLNEKIIAAINIKNTGRTPALNVATAVHFFRGINPVLEDFSTTIVGPHTPRMIIGPDEVRQPTFTWEHAIYDREELEYLRAGSRTLCVGGTVFYTDIFGKNHETKFCGSMTGDQIKGIIMASCPHWNTAD